MMSGRISLVARFNDLGDFDVTFSDSLTSVDLLDGGGTVIGEFLRVPALALIIRGALATRSVDLYLDGGARTIFQDGHHDVCVRLQDLYQASGRIQNARVAFEKDLFQIYLFAFDADGAHRPIRILALGVRSRHRDGEGGVWLHEGVLDGHGVGYGQDVSGRAVVAEIPMDIDRPRGVSIDQRGKDPHFTRV